MEKLTLKLPGFGGITPPPNVPTGGLITKGQDAIRAGLSFFLIIVLLLALLYIFLGAIRYIYARGDKEKIQGAREKITYSIVGLIIAFLAFLLVSVSGHFLNVPLISTTSVLPTPPPDLSCVDSLPLCGIGLPNCEEFPDCNINCSKAVWCKNASDKINCCDAAPVPPAISVNPASIDFGDVLVGTGPTRTFDVQNTGGGVLIGTIAGWVGTPFSCVDSPCTYALAAGEIKAMTIKFAPTSQGGFSTTLTFSGGAGVSRTVIGFGTVLIIPTSTPTPTPITCTLGFDGTCTDHTASSPYHDYCDRPGSLSGFVTHFYSCDTNTQLCVDNTDTDCSTSGLVCQVQSNGSSMCVVPPSIDLTIFSGDPLDFSPAQPAPGQNINFTVNVQNTGSATSPQTTVRFYEGASEPFCNQPGWFGEVPIDFLVVSAIDKETFIKLGGFAFPGTYTVWVFVDPTCTITELNDTNNTYSISITVK